MKLKTYYGWYY